MQIGGGAIALLGGIIVSLSNDQPAQTVEVEVSPAQEEEGVSQLEP